MGRYFEPAVRAFDAYARLRYRVLVFALLLTLAVGPLSDALGIGSWLLWLFVALNLVVAAAGITGRKGSRHALVAISAAVVVIRLVPEERLPTFIITAAGLLGLMIATVAMAGAVRFALRGTGVDAEHIAAALSAYLLAGFLFAVLYVLVDLRWPGSVVEVAGGAGGPLTLDGAIYYSFVTLATLGYGDIVPRGVARGIAVVEAVSAQLYLTVTVARLVSLYTQSAVRPPTPGGRDPA